MDQDTNQADNDSASEYRAFLARLRSAVPPDASLTERIALFVKWGRAYFSYARLERIAPPSGPFSDRNLLDPDLDRLAKLQRSKNEWRTFMVTHGPDLAIKLGSDPVRPALLKFLHRIDGGGGATAAMPIWEDVKVGLQLAALKLVAEVKPPSEKGPAKRGSVSGVEMEPEQVATAHLLKAISVGDPIPSMSECARAACVSRQAPRNWKDFRAKWERAKAGEKRTIRAGHIDARTGAVDTAG